MIRERAPVSGSLLLGIAAFVAVPERSDVDSLVSLAQSQHDAFAFMEAAMTLDVVVASGAHDAEPSGWLTWRADRLREIARLLAHARHSATPDDETARLLDVAQRIDAGLGADHAGHWRWIYRSELGHNRRYVRITSCPNDDLSPFRNVRENHSHREHTRIEQPTIEPEVVLGRVVRGAVGTLDDARRQVPPLGD